MIYVQRFILNKRKMLPGTLHKFNQHVKMSIENQAFVIHVYANEVEYICALIKELKIKEPVGSKMVEITDI